MSQDDESNNVVQSYVETNKLSFYNANSTLLNAHIISSLRSMIDPLSSLPTALTTQEGVVINHKYQTSLTI